MVAGASKRESDREHIMNVPGIRNALNFFGELDLLDADDAARMMWLFESNFPFRSQRELADSLHVHIKVPDADALPDDAIRNAGAQTENRQSGYEKYAFPAGVNVIFSSIAVAEEDRLADARPVTRPFLDHVGLDMRKESADVRAQFDAVAAIADRSGWASVAQGGNGREVFCCHTQVAEKRWVYPPENFSAWRRPIEFAYGPLLVHAASMGCDLRPRDPFRATFSAEANPAPSCCGPAVSSAPSCCSPAKRDP